MTDPNESSAERDNSIPAGESLKGEVHDYWNKQSCDTWVAAAPKHTREYFEEIERFRYHDQPFIHSFAQFTRYRNKRVLEVGVGAGTDFIQWLRAGANVSGVDLTQEAIDNVRHRIGIYQLPSPVSLQVADAEHLPFDDGTFDLGYSFGVLHHTPDTDRAVKELVRVVKPGGEVKIMHYNVHSLCAFKTWVKHALLAGRPWKGLHWAVWNYIESIGTKAYSRNELRTHLSTLPLENIKVRTEVTAADYLAFSESKAANLLARAAIHLAGERIDWQREDFVGVEGRPPAPASRSGIVFSGNPLGWFHCISATKRSE